jgi:hypothetical protein
MRPRHPVPDARREGATLELSSRPIVAPPVIRLMPAEDMPRQAAPRGQQIR